MQLLAVSLLVGASAFVAPRKCSQRTVRVAQGETGEDVVAAAVEAVVAVEEPAFVEPLVEEPASFEPIVAARRIVPQTAWYTRALPWAARPAMLDGTLAADAGFDPAGFVNSRVELYTYREAEIKHSRLAMLAAAGWPIAELWDDGIATALGLPSIIAENGGRDPSVLNGGLGLISPVYWIGVLAAATAIELNGETRKEKAKAADKTWMLTGSYTPGDLAFDPLGLYTALEGSARGRYLMETAEIKNGRLAMMAVLIYVIEEFVTGRPVVENTPVLFEPFWKLVEDIMFNSPAPYSQGGY